MLTAVVLLFAFLGPVQRLTEWTLLDATDGRDDLVVKMSRLIPSAQVKMGVHVTSLDVRDVSTGEGLVYLRLAPMPSSRPMRGFDFEIDGTSAMVVPLTNGYPIVKLPYRGGEAGRMAALQRYQREVRPYRPGRDGVLLSNTWGDNNADARINAAFMEGEIAAGAELGVDVIQVDDGWQRGRTANTRKQPLPGFAKAWGNYWDTDPRFWDADADCFPEGLKPLVDAAARKGIVFGLWFGPDSTDDLKYWERDADFLLGLYRKFGIRYFKIDSLKITSLTGQDRNRRFFDKLLAESKGEMVFDLDCTAGVRPGYFGMMDIGPLFLENRYPRKHKIYRPYMTLRNLWSLAHVVDPVRLRIEFLNPASHPDLWGDDPLAPSRWPADALFAIAMTASPLAWMELSGIRPETMAAWKPLVATWKRERVRMHGGTIFPVAGEPDGYAWTGFVSRAADGVGGYVLLFRELNKSASFRLDLGPWMADNTCRSTRVLGGRGTASIAGGRFVDVTVPENLDFIWLKVE